MERASPVAKKADPVPAAASARAKPAPKTASAALQSRIGASGVRHFLAKRGGHGSRKKDGGPEVANDRSPAPHGAHAHAQHKKPKHHVREPHEDKAKLQGTEEAESPKAGGRQAQPQVKLHMPEPPTGPSKATLKRIAGVKARAGGKAKAEASLPSASKQVGDAQKAVTSPDAERIAEARAKLIAEVHAAPSPEIVKLCERIRQVIRDKRPPDEDALAEAEPAKEASDAGNQLNSTVQSESKKVTDNYGPMDGPAKPEQAVPGTAVPAQPAAAPTAAVNAKAAVPDAVPPQSVSLDKDAEETRKKSDAAGMNKPAAALVKSGPIAEAREAQGELDQVAKEDPAEVLAKQKEALAKADEDMGALQMRALQALTRDRQGTTTKDSHHQKAMVGSEEQMRVQAGADAKVAFEEAQSTVKGLLKDLVPNAMNKWEAAKAILTKQFKDDLAIVKKRVDERHSGASGFVVGLWDAVTGLPGWATDAYDRAENNFAEGVIAKLTEISTEVNSIIQACEAIIKKARDKIAEIFSALPQSLKGWAAQEQAKFDQDLDKLGAEVSAQRNAFTKDISQRASEAVDEVRAEISELRKKAGGLVGRIVDAVKRFVDDPVKFIIEGLLELLGISPPAFWAVVAKIKKVVKDIIDDPVGFANNLLKGIGQGFSQFFGNFAAHMIRGFLTWLLGDLKDVEIPKSLSLKSIITFFLQIMGITWPNIRKIIAKKIGEKNVALIERVYSLISMLIEQGPEGIYEMIKEKLDPQSIVDQVIQMAVEYMVTAIAKQVAVRLLMLFNPAGAILQAIEAIYRVLKWVFENAARIFTLIETIVNGLADIIAGNVGGFANAVEKGLAMLIAPVLGFIADYFSLGDLPKTVAKQIKSFREWILGKIEAGFDWLIEKGKALLAAIGIGKKPEDKKKAGEADDAVGEPVEFDVPGESHTLYIEVTAGGANLMVASDKPMSVLQKLNSFANRTDELPKASRALAKQLIGEARPLAKKTDQTADDIVREKTKSKSDPVGGAKKTKVVAEEKELAGILKKLYTIFGEHGAPPLVGTYLELRSGLATKDQESHHVPPKGVLSWLVDAAAKAESDLAGSPFATHADHQWIGILAKTHPDKFNPGNELAAIAIDKSTHIKKTGDPTRDAWRVHWGEKTAKAVFKKLASKKVKVLVNNKEVYLSMVFIKRKLYADLTPEDKMLLQEMQQEGAQLTGDEIGTVPDAAGRAISTQFFKSELWAALEEAQGQAKIDIEKFASDLGRTARGAAAQAFAAVEAALQASKSDGSTDEKKRALGELRGKSRETWNTIPGLEDLHVV